MKLVMSSERLKRDVHSWDSSLRPSNSFCKPVRFAREAQQKSLIVIGIKREMFLLGLLAAAPAFVCKSERFARGG